jgi:26S proteasome regulatory subunit T1
LWSFRVANNPLGLGGAPAADETKYLINIRQIAKFVVGLGDKVSPTDIDEGMRVGVDRVKYAIQIPLPPKIDPSVSLMEIGMWQNQYEVTILL